MTGNEVNIYDENKLNDDYANHLEQQFKGSNLVLMYSTEEPTYNNHTLPLIEFLKIKNIPYSEEICTFKLHGEAGSFFKPFVYNFLTNINTTV